MKNQTQKYDSQQFHFDRVTEQKYQNETLYYPKLQVESASSLEYQKSIDFGSFNDNQEYQKASLISKQRKNGLEIMNRNREFSFKQIHAGLNKEGNSSIEALQKLISGKINQLNSQFDSLTFKHDEQNQKLVDNNRQTFQNELEKQNFINDNEQFQYGNGISQYDSQEEYLESDINENENNFFSRQKKNTAIPFSNYQVHNDKRVSLLTKGVHIDSMIEQTGREDRDYEIYSEPDSPSTRYRNTTHFHRKKKKAKTISTTNYNETFPQSRSSISNIMKLIIEKRSDAFIGEQPEIDNSNSNESGDDSGDDNTDEDSQSDFLQDNNQEMQEEFDQSGALSREEISVDQEQARQEQQEHFKLSLEGTFLGQSIGKPIKKYSFPLEFRNKNVGMDEKIREKFLLIQNYQHLLKLETTSFSSNQYNQKMLSKQIIPNHPEYISLINNCKSYSNQNNHSTENLETIQDSKFAQVDFLKGRQSKCYPQNIYGQVSSESINNILQILTESLLEKDKEQTSIIENRMNEKNQHNSLAADKRGDKKLILEETQELSVPLFSLSVDLANNDCIPKKEKTINVPVLDSSPKKILKRNRNESSSQNHRHHHQNVQKSVTYFQNPQIDLGANNLAKNSRLEQLYSKSISFNTDNNNSLL